MFRDTIEYEPKDLRMGQGERDQSQAVGLWQPITFDRLLSDYSLSNPRVWGILFSWLLIISVALGATIFLLPKEWLSLTGNRIEVIQFFLFNPALLLGIILFFWFGFEWGFIPVFLCSFIIAFHSSMPWGWALVFGIAFVMGLAICAMAYQGFNIPYDLRSFKSIVFYISIMFIASIGSSLGAFIWSFTHQLSAFETLVIWKGWWSGSFLQAIFITGPIIAICSPTVENLKSKWFQKNTRKTVSIKWVFGAVTSITCALALFIFSGKFLGKLRVREVMTEQKAATVVDVLNSLESFEIISWISIGIIVITGYGAFTLISRWNNHLNQEVRKRTEELNESQGKLKESLDEKKILLKEIHHRVKNNLALVSALLELQEKTPNSTTEGEGLKTARARIKSMALAHEALYENQSLSDISMKEYIKRIGKLTHKSFATEKIELFFELEDATLEMSKSIPLGLIINEILINAYKHAFIGQEKGFIKLKSNTTNDVVDLIIQDNGVGLPRDFEELKSNSLGMKLIRRFSKQLHAELSVESKELNGTKYQLIFST